MPPPESSLTAAPARPDDGVGVRQGWERPLGGAIVIVAAVAGARLGLKPISDNSELVHLRTGIQLVNTGHVPHRDPYSFTAAGHPWVVQSWLASLLYGAANSIGHHALLLEQAVIFAAVAAVTALAARSTSTWRWGLAALVAISASAPGWSPRPLMLGLLCLALTILVTERRAHPLWLVPVVWVWVNSHGSFPLGMAWIGARTVGDLIDRWGWPRESLRYLGGFAAGLIVACANPFGTKLLTFPLVAIHKKSTFQGIVEWRSPNFQDTNSFIALVFIAVALVILLRAALPWRHLLPVAGFVVAALVPERNLSALGVVLAPALGLALASAPRRDWVPPAWTFLVARGVAFAGAAVFTTIFLVRAVGGATLDLSSYPVAAVDDLARTGRLTAAHRVAASDVVGCFLVWRVGPATKVFIDDRYDMYPKQVTTDAAILAGARSDSGFVLDQWHIDTVVWSANQALPQELISLGGWKITWSDPKWVVLERTATV